MTVSLIHADAGHIPLADGTVSLVVTSPPYWALRSYRDGDAHYDGQLGSYQRIARWRDQDGGLRCKALGVAKPEKQLEGQMSLLGEVGS